MSVARQQDERFNAGAGASAQPLEQRLSGDLDALQDFARELAQTGARSPTEPLGNGSNGSTSPRYNSILPNRIGIDSNAVEQGLAKLVLTLIELLRRLLEKQAIRRSEAGSLTEDEVERLGQTFLKLEQRMAELKATFGLQDEDLNLNLGPLGDLL